jgi:hypothetical protein
LWDVFQSCIDYYIEIYLGVETKTKKISDGDSPALSPLSSYFVEIVSLVTSYFNLAPIYARNMKDFFNERTFPGVDKYVKDIVKKMIKKIKI